MKKDRRLLVIMIMALVFALALAACGKKDEEEAGGGEEPQTTDAGPAVVMSIDDIDDESQLGLRLPLQIAQIVLYEDGTVELFPTDDLRKNELGDSGEDSLFPFADSGEVSQIYVVDYGNGGYRTVVALMSDGTISAINGRALVEDHIIAVMDNVSGRDNFIEVKNVNDEDANVIVGVTSDGQEVILDYSLNF